MYYGYGYGYGKVGKVGGVTYDADAQSWFDMLSGITEARKVIVNDLILGLKADGNYSKLDRLWLLAAEDEVQAAISIVKDGAGNSSGSPASECVAVNAPTFVADRGYTGNASTSYLNTQYVPSTDGVTLTLNSSSIGFYSRTDQTGLYLDMESRGSAEASWLGIHARFFGDTSYAINDATYGSVTTASSQGLFSARRTASNAKAVFKNGVSINTGATASISLPNTSVFICGSNRSGLYFPSSKQFACAFFGSGAIDQAALYTRIQTYMTAIGANV